MLDHIEESEVKREGVLRRALARHGYQLKKTPARHWARDYYGVGYMVITDHNVVVVGAGSREYDGTLQQCGELLDRLNQQA